MTQLHCFSSFQLIVLIVCPVTLSLYVFFLFLSYRPVSNASEVMQIISSVLKRRAHCPTLVHTDSSRSHLIVTLTISSKSPNAVALGEMHSFTRRLPHVDLFIQLSVFITFSFSPQATECQEGHAALHPEGVVESTMSPCQPCRPPLIWWTSFLKQRLLSRPLPFQFSLPLPQTQHVTDSLQDQAAAGGPGRKRVCW